MKRRLLLVGLMCLVTVCTWAKDMTVLITDSKDLPIPGLQAFISGIGSDGAGDYTTDANGKFVVKRSSLNFLSMRVAGDDYELVWTGGNDPVVVKLEGHYWLTLALKEVESEQYSLFTGIDLFPYRGSLYNKEHFDIKWTDSGTFSFLYKGEQLYWELTGSVSGVTSVSTIDVEELTDGRIEVNNPLAGKQKITVAVKDETNALCSGLITISGPQQSYEQAITAQPTDIYLPKGTYYIGARITGKEAYYIPIYQEISLADSPIEQTFSYETGKKVTVRVLDMDGLPIENAIVSQLIPSNDYWDGQKTDARGEVTYIATAGTYTYRVLAVIGTDKQSYRSIEGEIVVGSQEMVQEISYKDQYFRISLDITPGSFMTDPSQMNVSIAGNTVQYNEQTGLYTTVLEKSNDNSYYPYYISYPDMFTKEGEIHATKHETIPISFTDYHKVTFTSSDIEKYELTEIYVNSAQGEQSYNFEADHGYYLPDGDYEITATITDRTTQESFPGISKQLFTVAGQEMTVTYTLNENDYHQVIISVIDRTGKPMAEASVTISTRGNTNTYTADEQGKIKLHLPDGTYTYRTNLTDYKPQERSFKIAGADMDIRLSFENYKELTFKVNGDLLEMFKSANSYGIPMLTLVNHAIEYRNTFALFNGNPTDGFTGSYYLPADDYAYSLEITQGKRINTPETLIKLDTDKTETITLSTADYQKVALNVVDENGTAWPVTYESSIYICNSTHKDKDTYIYRLDTYNGSFIDVYLPQGEYVAKFENRNNMGETNVSTAEFSVADQPQTVTLTHKEAKEASLTIKVKGIVSEYDDYCSVQFYKSGIPIRDYGIRTESGTGEKTIQLPEGTYTYRVDEPEGKELSGTVTLPADKELTFDYSTYRNLQVQVQDEEGQYIDRSSEISVYQDGKFIYSGNRSIYAMFPAGVYQIRAWCKGYKAVSQSVTIGETDQTITLKLPKETANTYTVQFLVADCYDSEYTPEGATVSLEGYGQLAAGYEGDVSFTDIVAGDVSYTISAPGYTTLKGVVNVSAEKAKDNGYVPVFAILQPVPTGIEETPMSSNSFSIWTDNDYLYINTNSTSTDLWTLQLVSINGSLVYTSKQHLDTENNVYIGNNPKGIYLFVLSNGKQRIAYKVIKN
ncbi:T9SS type A sorting domain-containing protein [Bacteroides nordii]|uniref:T9SS type A sorting domain-containing protein n=1 Tax=Bacteroides nordii TaxID=291645 RepID=UPI00242041BD|nr:T9SS type A sorting domain-containing protein [Bacteroides nordii]MBD9109773.1 T9SS C-terminal target domain-containing protein [Bacteroides nordii]